MKKLRFTLITCLLMALAMPVIQSCLNDWNDNDYNNTSLTIGTLKIIEGKNYYFNLDEGGKMYPGDTTYVHNYSLVDGQRVFIHFQLLSKSVTGYDYNAQIYRIENILTKNIIPLTEATADSIGNDPINATDIWIAGGCLNIQYQLYYSPNADKKHMLNLVTNETSGTSTSDENYVDLGFRHNAYNDMKQELGWGVVSFKLDNIANQTKGKKGLKVHVNTIYDGERIITIDFQTTTNQSKNEIKNHLQVSSSQLSF